MTREDTKALIDTLGNLGIKNSLTDDQLTVMQAYIDGADIEIHPMSSGTDSWEPSLEPEWKWNRFDYRVKPERWRAKNGGQYYYIDEALRVEEDIEGFFDLDDHRYRAGNYFKTIEKAMAAAEEIEAVLTKYGEA